ncbi:MAG: type II secretion system protein [Burkholderiales bacterium]
MPHARRHRGFSLIEVLVAFVILSLVATALFRLFSASLNNASAAEGYSRAVLVAESRLDAAAAQQPLKEAEDRGTDDDGRIAWQTRVEPYVVPDLDRDLERASEGLAMRMLRITVDVTFTGADGRPRTFSLATVRMGPRLATAS